MAVICPICSTDTRGRVGESPYWDCPGCGLWFQDPMPPKIWHGEHETWVGKPMPQAEKDANAQLARFLFDKALGGKPARTYDVGASYPWLAKSLAELGCEATANDPSEELRRSTAEFKALRDLHFDFCDFEGLATTIDAYAGDFGLISFVHSFEHLYRPHGALLHCDEMLSDRGAVFIRMPDHTVEGYERDMTPGHYSIHPYYHSLSSIAELCVRTGAFRIEYAQQLQPGQADLILRRL